MHKLILSIIATISFFTLVMYDFLTICRIIKREELIERIWKQIFPDKTYNEKLVFIMVRPILLNISCITYILSASILVKNFIFNILLTAAPILAAFAIISNINRK